MKMLRNLPDLWLLEKAITAIAMVTTEIVIVAMFVLIGEHLGWIAATLFAVAALYAVSRLIMKYIPLSQYLGVK